MINGSFKDILFPEFAGGGYSPDYGGGATGFGGASFGRLGPAGYPPVWSQDPFSDLVYLAIYDFLHPKQVDPKISTHDILMREILGPDIKIDGNSPYSVASNGPIYTLGNSDTPRPIFLGYFPIDGKAVERWLQNGEIHDYPVELGEEITVTAQPDSQRETQSPTTSSPAVVPPTYGSRADREALTERMLYRDMSQSGYSPDAVQQLGKYYDRQFDWSVGNLHQVLLKRAAAFATASSGQWRNKDYLNSIGNGYIASLDIVGVAFSGAGDSWKKTIENLAKGVLIGGVVGSLGATKAAVADKGSSLGPQIDSSLSVVEPKLESALPSTEAPSLPASRPTFGNLGGPQGGKLAGVLRREGRIYYLEGSTTPLAGKHDFIIKNGEILVGEGHGFLAGGERVTWAGELNFANDGSGVLESFSNVSGHIRPSRGFVGNVRSPLLTGVTFVPPTYFPIQSGLPQLPVFPPGD